MEQIKVKAVWWNDPSRTREFTKAAFGYVTSPKGWILAADQTPTVVEKKTGPVANPAAIANHNAQELDLARADYKNATGKEPDQSWNEPKLFIETQKFLKANGGPVVKVEEPVQEQGEVVSGEAEVSEKPEAKKRGRKPKTVEA